MIGQKMCIRQPMVDTLLLRTPILLVMEESGKSRPIHWVIHYGQKIMEGIGAMQFNKRLTEDISWLAMLGE